MRIFGYAFLAILLFLPLGAVSAAADSADVAAHRAELERDLSALEAEIAKQQAVLDQKRDERVSLERDIAILDAEIKKAQLSIRARDLAIQKLTTDIGSKSDTITALDEKLLRERQSLAEILRKTNELDNATLVEFLLASENISVFFADIDSFATLKASLRESFDTIEDTKAVTADEKAALEERRTDEQQLRTLQVLEKQKIEEKQTKRSKILSATKGQEDEYQKLVSSIEKSAAEIRAELFTLRDSAAIPFGQALEFANRASEVTGVRPALVLGVLKQETRLGEFLGTGTYRVDMHPTRDVPVYLKITQVLGLDPSIMPVSKQPGYGWGGAMGPAQFIPSTWACFGGFVNVSNGKCGPVSGSYAGPWEYDPAKDRIRQLLKKKSPGNPWENQDAFMASALLLKDNGASRGTYASERLAALRYFAGWGNAEKPAYAFYGDGVMGFATEFQKLIDQLGGS